jgi:hypothetical protein
MKPLQHGGVYMCTSEAFVMFDVDRDRPTTSRFGARRGRGMIRLDFAAWLVTITGRAPMQFLHSLRISRAAELRTRTDLPVKDGRRCRPPRRRAGRVSAHGPPGNGNERSLRPLPPPRDGSRVNSLLAWQSIALPQCGYQ